MTLLLYRRRPFEAQTVFLLGVLMAALVRCHCVRPDGLADVATDFRHGKADRAGDMYGAETRATDYSDRYCGIDANDCCSFNALSEGNTARSEMGVSHSKPPDSEQGIDPCDTGPTYRYAKRWVGIDLRPPKESVNMLGTSVIDDAELFENLLLDNNYQVSTNKFHLESRNLEGVAQTGCSLGDSIPSVCSWVYMQSPTPTKKYSRYSRKQFSNTLRDASRAKRAHLPLCSIMLFRFFLLNPTISPTTRLLFTPSSRKSTKSFFILILLVASFSALVGVEGVTELNISTCCECKKESDGTDIDCDEVGTPKILIHCNCDTGDSNTNSIDFSDHNLTAIEENAFDDIQCDGSSCNIEVIHLEGNSLRTLPGDLFKKLLDSLVELRLHSNNLENIPRDSFITDSGNRQCFDILHLDENPGFDESNCGQSFTEFEVVAETDNSVCTDVAFCAYAPSPAPSPARTSTSSPTSSVTPSNTGAPTQTSTASVTGTARRTNSLTPSKTALAPRVLGTKRSLPAQRPARLPKKRSAANGRKPRRTRQRM
eukprot:gb/GECG01015674.1/.p1 GENE.gb/GECG01015674.1/~~gb/GECG01015674.1/.p1  ORF type:complete len:541 (+),score=42.56 gb/GECG01015674.1/:1-1623(+)